MATASQTLAGKAGFKMGKIVNFSPEVVKAPFFLRVASALIDYMLMMFVPVAWLIVLQYTGDGTATSIGLTVWLPWAILYLLNFLLLPLLTGRSVGKLLTGITIVNRDGTDARLGALLLRCTLGYLATVLTVGVGFLLGAMNSSGRTLHDIISNTVVIRAQKTLI